MRLKFIPYIYLRRGISSIFLFIFHFFSGLLGEESLHAEREESMDKGGIPCFLFPGKVLDIQFARSLSPLNKLLRIPVAVRLG